MPLEDHLVLAEKVRRAQLELTEYTNHERGAAYVFEGDIPQTLAFAIDAMSTLSAIFASYPRFGEISFLDLGPGYGAAAGLISQMFCGHFLGPKVNVEVMDIHDHRQKFIELTFPLVKFRLGTIDKLQSETAWDVVFCSNVIEHTVDPKAFIAATLSHTKDRAVFLAPYREQEPLTTDHRSVISDETFAGFQIEKKEIFQSLGWGPTSAGERHQVLTVLNGTHKS
ncbi:MAG: methyltransferase domain-containing protein [Thermoguttaceae bacterium]